MSRVGMIVVAAAVLLTACGEKKDGGNTGVSGGTEPATTDNRVNQDTGTGSGLAASPAVGASAGTTATDAGAMAMAPTGSTGSMGSATGSTGSATTGTAPTGTGASTSAGPSTGSSASTGMATADAGSTMDAGTAGGSKAGAKSAVFTDADRQQAQQVFASRCTPCHGPTGKGDGAAAVALNPKPRNFSDGSWQASVTDEHIEKIIALGGGAVGKSPLMPPNPDLAGKPVIPALREYVRNFGAKSAK